MRLILALILVPLTAYCQINKNGDFQIWHDTELTEKITERQRVRIESELRFGDDATRLFLAYAQMQWIYAKEFWEIAPGYRHIFVRDSHSHWRTVYSPIMDISLKFNIRNWMLIDRSRIQYIIDDHFHRWRYRNRMRLIIPLNSFSFVTDEEVFFLEGRGFTQNRISLGLIKEFNDHTIIRIIYMLRHVRNPRWDHQNIMGLFLYLSF